MLKHSHKLEFMQAADLEWTTLSKMKILEILERSQATTKPLPLTWVFRYKFDKHGFLQKFKARICVRGDLQPLTEKDTYAATLAARSFRTLMALAARWDLEIRQLDAVNAFPNSELDEEVYIELPDGYKLPGKVGRLLRALYGLRRSPLLWQKLLSSALRELSMQPGLEEPCLFLTNHLIVFFFVDDICYMFRARDQAIADAFRDNIHSRFKIRDLGELKWFLGIRVVRDRSRRRLWLCQDSYMEAIAARFNLTTDKPPATPIGMHQLVANEDIADHATTHLYQRKIGSALYPAVITRPDIAFTAAKLSSFLSNPSPDHMAAANRCIQYLYGSRHLAIMFDGLKNAEEKAFISYTDASFADDVQDRKSTQGYLLTLFGGPIAWKSGKQTTVTTSSTEAELLGLTTAAKEAIAAIRLFRDVRLQLNEDLTIWCDNKQTIRLVSGDMMRIQTALRHVDIHHCWARQEAKKGSFEVKYLPTNEMPADGLTKALDRGKFERFVAQLGLTPLPEIEIA
jgi:Reverse transcriptase (RNA-dependent DNA polymerase)